MRTFLASAALVTASFLLGPSAAYAQAYVSPSLGVVFANPSAQGRADLVIDAGGVPRNSPLGAELDVMYAPSFFGNAGPLGENSVSTAMVNLIIAGGDRGRYGFGRRRSTVRPYVSGGIGLMHEVVTTTSTPVQQISNNDLGVNLGAGVLAFTHRSFGIRGDVRYFRDLKDNQQGNTTNIDFGSFHFWRASIGVILAF
jgi:outer membrane protein with beta-barrel domain